MSRTYPKNRTAAGLSDEAYIRATLDRLDFDRAIQALRSSTRLQRLRARVLAEESSCHICGEAVDKSLSGHHPDGPTMEHLIPVRTSEGVWRFFDREHVRLAHRRCNCGEGDSIQRRMERERVALSAAARWLGAYLN